MMKFGVMVVLGFGIMLIGHYVFDFMRIDNALDHGYAWDYANEKPLVGGEHSDPQSYVSRFPVFSLTMLVGMIVGVGLAFRGNKNRT